MKNVSFKTPEGEHKFKEFVCKHKVIIIEFLELCENFKNPIARITIGALATLVKGYCEEFCKD